MNRLAVAIATAAIIALAALLAYAAYAKHAGRLELDTIARQLRGELSESERALVTANSVIRKSRSTVTTLRALNDANTVTLERLRHALGSRDIEIHRQSRLIADLTGRVESPAASTATPAGAYTARTSWYEFSTPDVFDAGAQTTLALDLQASLTITGIRQRRGVLESETVDLMFADRDGVAVPINVAVRDYELSCAPKVDTTPWYRRVGLDGVATIDYAWPDETLRARALAEVRLWRVGLHAGAELDSEQDANLVAGLSYRREVF